MQLVFHHGLLGLGQLEVWILDQPDDVAERIGHRSDLDLLADLVRRRRDRRTGGYELPDRLVQPVPANTRPFRRARAACPPDPDQPVAADVEADVERLVEVGRLLKSRRVPRLGAVDVPDVIDDGRKSI